MCAAHTKWLEVSFCRPLSLTALCVLTGCVKCLFRPGSTARGSETTWTSGRLRRRNVLFLSQSASVDEASPPCLGFGGHAVLFLSRAVPLNYLPHSVTLFDFHKMFLKLERPWTSCAGLDCLSEI